jgi:serine/threonine protein kinase
MTSPVKEGDVLAGKYRIERVLGVGGMGIVVAATHVQLDQRVALKFLLPDALATPDLVARFAREARAAARIESEHVARVIDVGTLESGSPYMVMEYLEGKDLSWVIHERGALPVEEAASYVLQTCEALASAHAAGIVHRDLKPANLFLAERPDREAVIKVLDFGISKVGKGAGGSDDLSLTKTSSLVGSPLYMSPEQMATPKDVDVRCDIWALGVIFYELLSGETPFTSDSVTGIVAAILQSHPRLLSDLRPEIPAEVSAIIMRCLEKDPARRFQSVSQLARALARFSPRTGRSSVERIARVLGTSVETSPTLIQTMPPPTSLPAAISGDRSPLSSTAGQGSPSSPSTLSSRGATSTGSAAWGTTHGGADNAHRRGIVIGVAAALALVGAMVAGGLIVLHLNRTSEAPVAPASAAAMPPPPGEPRASDPGAASAGPGSVVSAPPEPRGVEPHALDAKTLDASAPPAKVGAIVPHAAAAHAGAHVQGAAPASATPPPDPKLEIRLQR